jgi:hypothetical protein
MFRNFHLVRIQQIAINSTTTEARLKIATNLKFLEFKENFDECLTKFRNNQILINKIRRRFLVTAELFTSQKHHH